MNGGYILINCKGLELTSQVKQTVAGIYNAVQEAYTRNKPVYAYNCKWKTEHVTPIEVMINIRPSGNYTCTASTLQLEVDPENGVTVVNMLAGNNAKKASK